MLQFYLKSILMNNEQGNKGDLNSDFGVIN